MLNFSSDYLEGCAPEILEALTKTNLEKTDAYGLDIYSTRAKEKILKACKNPNGEVFFISGGTQTNQIVIDATLRSFEGVIACTTGHINFHEAGAIEFGGHKVLTVPNHNGKINPVELEQYMDNFINDANHDHMILPKMVYLSFPTEYGTLYTKNELESISRVCHKYDLYLYLDGARLGYGLEANDNDVTLDTLAKLCDMFYIGGTKVGAMFGEALVLQRKDLVPHLFTIIKQHGALLAKGRMLGIQFETLFTNDLYTRLSKNAIEMANILRAGLKNKGCSFYLETSTNQIFLELEDKKLNLLAKKMTYSFWEKPTIHTTVIRLATSWATQKEDVLLLLDLF